MIEENKFKEVDSIQLYSDDIGYVKLYNASHANESEAQRVWTVTQICSLAYGNESAKNPEALYERMKSIKHESLWEMCYNIIDIQIVGDDDARADRGLGY
jgi:predicted RNA-binding protein with PUA-like domain